MYADPTIDLIGVVLDGNCPSNVKTTFFPAKWPTPGPWSSDLKLFPFSTTSPAYGVRHGRIMDRKKHRLEDCMPSPRFSRVLTRSFANDEVAF